MSSVDRFLVIFPSIVFEAMPFIILGALISGALEELLPQRLVTDLIPKRKGLAIAVCSLLGLVFPMCECGIVPVIRRLLGKGLPLGCAVAYMLAGPIINPVVMTSTWAAFSGDRSGLDGLTSFQMVALRCGLGFITAFIVGHIVDRLSQKHGDNLVRPLLKPRPHHHHHDHEHSHDHSHDHAHDHPHHDHDHAHENCGECHDHNHEHDHHHEKPAGTELPLVATVHDVHDASVATELQKKTVVQRIISISETALHDFIDIACFLTLGAFIAAVVQTMRIMDMMPELSSSPILATPVMMALAILLCLCSEADAFVAANLPQIPLAGKLGFLVLGPMLDFKLYFMYTRVFRAKLIWTIISSLLVIVFCLSLAAHYLDAAARGPKTVAVEQAKDNAEPKADEAGKPN